MSRTQEILRALDCASTNEAVFKYGIKWKDGIYTFDDVDYEKLPDVLEAVYDANVTPEDESFAKAQETKALAKTLAIESMLQVTSPNINGREIEKVLGLVSADCAYGMNIFRDVFASFRDLVGGRSAAVEKVLKEAKQTVQQEMSEQAYALGGDAIISIDFDFNELDGGGKNGMLLVSGTGSAVKLRENKNDV